MRLPHSLLYSAIAVALALPLPAARFVPPEDTKALFRRDLLPIDTDMMRALSAQLTVLARRESDGQPLQLRASAQLLAIAARLDPANRPARELSRRLAGGAETRPPDSADLLHALGETWQILDWLLQPEAGSEAQLLGHQLLDALHVVDPNHPTSLRHDPAGESVRWGGIVAELTRFQEKPPHSSPPLGTGPPPEPPSAPEPPRPPVNRPPILLRQARVQTPLFLDDQDFKQELRIATISMDLQSTEDPGLLTFSLVPEFKSPFLVTARERVRLSLERTWSDLPVGSIALLESDGQRYAFRNNTAISGPASLLLHAALAGKPLRDDLVFLGDLQDDGSLTRPLWSWDYLRVLRSGMGGRLLVPPALQAELRAMIALEDPGFFLKWEILMVSSVEAALNLATVDAGPESLAAASEMFADIRRVGEGKDVGQLCVNLHVRKRLGEIQAEAPYHFSSAMLLLQGSGQRPIRVDPEVASRILRSAVEPLANLARVPLSSLSAKGIDEATQLARAEVDRFAKYFLPTESGLHQEAVGLTDLAHALARGKQLGKPDPDGATVTPEGILFSSLQEQLQARIAAFARKLAPHTGEPMPESSLQPAQKAQN